MSWMITFGLLISAWILPTSASAQALSISAEVDKNVVGLNDQIVLTVTVGGNQTSVPDPQLPSLPDFTVYSSGRNQSINFVNGSVSSSIVYTYVLVPRFPGKVSIGPVSVDAGGKKISTAPIEIQVVRGGAPQASVPMPGQAPAAKPQPGVRPPPGNRGAPGSPAVYVTASLDKAQAYVNEQVTLTVRFYTTVNLLGNPQYEPPSTQGFISEDIPPERHGEAQNHGRQYHYSEIKTALFPAQPGRLAIGSAKVLCQVQSEMGVDPFAPDFFQKFFAQGLMSAQTRELRTDPLALHVLPLPENKKPASFTGAVGRFRVTAGVDRRSVKVGEAVTLTLTIDGKGNFKALGAPKLPDMPSLRVFDTISSMNLSKEHDVVQGSKIFKTVLVPRVSGKISIPSIPFGYFDPATSEYTLAGTAPIELEAAPGGPATPATGFIAQGGPSPDLTQVTEDIRYVKESTQVSRLSAVLARIGGRTWVHLFPWIAFLLALGVSQYRERLSMDPVGARFRSAVSKARKRLSQAQALAPTDPGRASELLSGALAGFLADKFNVSAHGLTLRQVQAALRSRFPKISEDAQTRLKSVWEDLDQLRFAGAGALDAARTDALVTGIDQLLQQLEKEMRR